MDRSLEVVHNVQHANTIGNGNVSTDDFFTDELLRRNGYDMDTFKNRYNEEVVVMSNLKLTVSNVRELKNCEVRCTGLPCKVTVNELIPLLEKAGRLYKLRMVVNAGITNAIYATEHEAEMAVKTLNNVIFQGENIKVRKFFPSVTLFVSPIPNRAMKTEIFNEFRSRTTGLEKVFLFNTLEDDRVNRGYCFLEYESNKCACNAKRNLTDKIVFGKQIVCDWPDKVLTQSPDTLYVNNLAPAIRTSDLRKQFSVFGDVIEIDKTGNFATIVFRNPSDSKRAVREIDKTKLGNENVEVSDYHITKKSSAERFGRHDETKNSSGTTATRFGPRNDYVYSNENTFRSDTEGFGPRTMNTKQNSFGATTSVRRDNPSMARPYQPDTTDRLDPRKSTFGSGKGERYGTRMDTMTSNSFDSVKTEGQGPRQGNYRLIKAILTSNKNIKDQGHAERFGPPKSIMARNAFGQGEKNPKEQH